MHRTLRVSVVGIAFAFAAPASLLAADEDSITGRVAFDGPPQKVIPITMPANQPHCQKMALTNPVTREDMPVVSKDGGLKNVFVQVKSGLDKSKVWPVPTEPVTLLQEGCHYKPHVFGVMAGQGLKVVNGDTDTNHNVHGLPKLNQQFNFSQAKKGMEKTVTFAKPEDFLVKCEVHTWMNARCFVTNHPFYAVTDAEGKFTIKGLPPGEYEIEFTHETLGKQTQKVKVEAGKAATADAKFKLASKGPIPAKPKK